MIERLPQERWPELEEIFRREFDSDLPHPSAAILADIQDGEIRGFVVVEFLARVGQVWETGSSTRAMLKWIEEQIPPDTGVIAIASDPRFESLCERFAMRRVEGVVYRRDF